MSTLTWLHLSDLHFRESDTYDANIVLKALLQDIPEQVHEHGLQLDFIIITGDIAFAGKPHEYELARLFLDDLLELTGVGKDRLFIVPGNHDVDRQAVTRAARLTAEHINESRSREELRRRVAEVLDENRQLLLQRFHHYADFVNDYFAGHFRFDDEHYFYTQTLLLDDLRVAILGLNTAWLSGADEESKKLVLDERQVRAALEQTEDADLRIVLLHHPFDWLHECDQEDVEPLLKDSCDFVLRGHLHKSKSELVVTPDSETVEIAAGACCLSRSYPNSYNLVRLDLGARKGKVVLRRFIDEHGGFWAEDSSTYRNARNGVCTFPLTKRLTKQLEAVRLILPDRLKSWLPRHGLRDNPFACYDAAIEEETHLSGYFVDKGRFYDELLETKAPCVVFADRGLGKTAYRQMLAAQCRPSRKAGSRLALLYSYGSFERLLVKAENDPSRIRPIDHVNELLRQGLAVLEEEALRGHVTVAELKRATLAQPKIIRHLSARLARYAPQLARDLLDGGTSDEEASGLELLKAFSSLVGDAGLGQCVVLVDGLDEWGFTVGKPAVQVALLAPLLGTLPIVQCPGWAFKFFLQQDLESTLRVQEWFRPGKVRILRIQEWDKNALQELIGRRLTYFSSKGSRVVVDLAQLCEDNLAQFINDELAQLAEGCPRWVIILADMLLRTHCRQDDPPVRLTQATWDIVKAEWPTRRADLLKDEEASVASQAEPGATETVQPVSLSVPLPSDWPLLRLDEEKGLVWLGERDITSEINLQDHRVLMCLYQHQGALCSKDLLAREAWLGVDQEEDQKEEVKVEGVSDQAIAASIARLRRVLRQSSPDEGYIETVRGRGYRLHSEGFKHKSLSSS